MSTQQSTKTARKRNNKKKTSGVKSKPNSNSQSSNLNPSMSSSAASYEVVLRNPNKFRISETKNHKEYGSGIRVSGSQQLVLVTTTNSNSQLFVNGVGTVAGINGVYIAPNYLNDRVAQFAAMYQRFAFRKICFIFVTRVATTQVGSMVLAYSSDGGCLAASSATALTYGTVQDLNPSVIVPFRKEIERLDMVYNGDRTWMCTFDTNASATAEAYRQCIQGTLLGYPDITSIGAINMGEIYIEYELDLYANTNINTNVTLYFNQEMKVFCSELVKRYKSLTDSEKVTFCSRYKELTKHLLV